MKLDLNPIEREYEEIEMLELSRFSADNQTEHKNEDVKFT
jgi:hypothetical protein